MKKIIFAALSFLVLGTSQASAGQYDCCDTACNPCSDWEFTAYVDYLYWDVCQGDGFIEANGDQYFLDPGYDSGYRLGLRMGTGDAWDAGIRYTHLKSSNSINFEDAALPLELALGHSIKYDVVDIELGYNLNFDCDSFHLRPFVGAKLAWIDNSYNADLTVGSVANTLSYSQDFTGYGLYTGLEGRYDVCNMDVCCSNLDIAFVARGSLGILKSSVSGSVSDDGVVLVSDFDINNCLYVTTAEAFVGLDFGYEWSECFAPHLLLGWEANTLIGMHQVGSENSRNNLGLSGLVARLSVGF